MILRPGWNLLGVAAAGVLVSAVAFYVPLTAWLLLPLLVAAASLSLFDALWLRRHQSDLVVTRDLPSPRRARCGIRRNAAPVRTRD